MSSTTVKYWIQRTTRNEDGDQEWKEGVNILEELREHELDKAKEKLSYRRRYQGFPEVKYRLLKVTVITEEIPE